jgi:hypothetical protein
MSALSNYLATLAATVLITTTAHAKNPLAPPAVAPDTATFVPIVPPPPSLVAFHIEVEGIGVLNPKPDITPEESAWLSIFLSIGVVSQLGYTANPDFAGFIKLHHLERHFDKVKP